MIVEIRTLGPEKSSKQKPANRIFQFFLVFVVCMAVSSVFMLQWWIANDEVIRNDEKVELELSQPTKKRERKKNDIKYHIVFSTGCNNHDWQSYVMFYHAYKSKQPGHVTRVASACTEEAGQKLLETHKKEIEPIKPGYFHLHLTPDYKNVKPNATYVFFNKGFGIRHWLEHSLEYSSNAQKFDNDIFILLDPDQIIMRPFTNDYSDESIIWRKPKTKQQQYYVKHGVPFGQEYGFSLAFEWLPKINMSNIAPKEELPSPVNRLSTDEARDGFPVGPPLIMTGRDFYKIVMKWTDFAPSVYDEKPGHITEMYAYSIAAAHLQLSHEVARSFMISYYADPGMEGWEIIDDQFSDTDVCAGPSPPNEQILPGYKLPHTFHFCHRYMLGKWFFNKYVMPANCISCDAPLLREPPNDISLKYDFGITRDGRRQNHTKPHVRKRVAFAICQLIYAVNEAAIHYKKNNCNPSTVNMNKTYIFHDNMKLEWSSMLLDLL